ncbi:MAG: GTPase [Pseudanabaenaceae cyanobacterium]
MNPNTSEFEAKAIASRIDQAIQDLCRVLLEADTEELNELRDKLIEEIREHKSSGVLTIAFVGQYNAGKSTTISALTGRRDIRIDSDVATDKTSEYDWGGIKLIDTPGLYAGRADHDEITYRAIARADLLVFCLTYMLFDSITVSNFKKLAYDEGYCSKMMLLINKMSDEAGELQQKIKSYEASLSEAIKPYPLSDFSPSYIDAKDYCEGCDTDDDLLKNLSSFPEFIQNLNKFIRKKNVLGRLDTPIRIALDYLDRAKSIVCRDSVKDDTFFELMNRLKRRLEKSKSRLDLSIDPILVDMGRTIVSEGNNLSLSISTKDAQDFETQLQESRERVKEVIDETKDLIQVQLEKETETLRKDVEELNHSELFRALQAKLDDAEHGNLLAGLEVKTLREQIEGFRGVGNIVFQTGLLVEAVDSFFGLSALLEGVEPLMGGLMDILGPGIAVYGAFQMIEEWRKQEEIDKKRVDAQIAIEGKFREIAREAEQSFKENLRRLKRDFYGKFEDAISKARGAEEEKIAVSNKILEKLIAVQRQLEGIRRELSRI